MQIHLSVKDKYVASMLTVILPMSFADLPSDVSNGAVVRDIAEISPTTNKKSSDGQSKLIFRSNVKLRNLPYQL